MQCCVKKQKGMFNSEYCYRPFSKSLSFIVGGVGCGGFVIVCNIVQNNKMICITLSIVERKLQVFHVIQGHAWSNPVDGLI